jgi:hypothetical protein
MVYKPPNSPAAFTGSLWLNPDKTIGGLISDVFNEPIHLVATKEGAQYRVQGWRGNAPEFKRIPLLDDPRPDGLPDDAPNGPCKSCEGRLFWRASIVSNPHGGGVWQCATCAPMDSSLYLDGVYVGR